MNAPTFHTDPGHGWLEVQKSELKRLGIADKVSGYSYQSRDGTTAYLEEDCDASLYTRALGLRFADCREIHSNDDSFVRSLPSYRVQS